MAKVNNHRSLYRSETNHIIGGVCGGLGEYFEIDPVIIRIIFLILAFFGGSGIPIYLILWLIVPGKSKVSQDQKETVRDNVNEIKGQAKKLASDFKLSSGRDHSKKIFGAILALVGVVILLENFGVFISGFVWRLWPALIIVVGILIINRYEKK